MPISSHHPQHGDLWLVDMGVPGQPRGPMAYEQGLARPAIVLTHDRWNRRAPGLYVIAPLTKRGRGSPWHVMVQPPDANVRVTSYILCEQIRVASSRRFGRYIGTVSPAVLADVKRRLTFLLAL
jgi:mRNA interferase MazF